MNALCLFQWADDATLYELKWALKRIAKKNAQENEIKLVKFINADCSGAALHFDSSVV